MCVCVCVYVHSCVCTHMCRCVGGVKHWTLEELGAFVKLVAWVLRSEFQSHYFTAGPSNHRAPFSSPLPVSVCLCVCLLFVIGTHCAIQAGLELEIPTSDCQGPVPPRVLSSLAVFADPFKLGFHGMVISDCLLLLIFYFTCYILKTYLVCDMGMGIQAMASVMVEHTPKFSRFKHHLITTEKDENTSPKCDRRAFLETVL